MMESFWSSMQIELLDRQRWSTRVELANAMFEYIEVPQPEATPFRARVPHPDRDRGSLRTDTCSSLILTTTVGNQTVGQVNMSPLPTSDPIGPRIWTPESGGLLHTTRILASTGGSLS